MTAAIVAANADAVYRFTIGMAVRGTLSLMVLMVSKPAVVGSLVVVGVALAIGALATTVWHPMSPLAPTGA